MPSFKKSLIVEQFHLGITLSWVSHLQEVGAAHSGFTEGFLCGESITCASHFVCAIEKYNILVHIKDKSN